MGKRADPDFLQKVYNIVEVPDCPIVSETVLFAGLLDTNPMLPSFASLLGESVGARAMTIVCNWIS